MQDTAHLLVQLFDVLRHHPWLAYSHLVKVTFLAVHVNSSPQKPQGAEAPQGREEVCYRSRFSAWKQATQSMCRIGSVVPADWQTNETVISVVGMYVVSVFTRTPST